MKISHTRPHGIKCGCCKGRHERPADVRQCYADRDADALAASAVQVGDLWAETRSTGWADFGSGLEEQEAAHHFDEYGITPAW